MSALDLLEDYRVAKVKLALQSGESVTLDCVARAVDPPLFELTFHPEVLPIENLLAEGKAYLSLDIAGTTHSMEARLDSVVSETRLQMVELQSFTHIQKRAYFRIDTRARVECCPLDIDELPIEEEAATVDGPVNLSGGGIRFSFAEELPAGRMVRLAITLAGDSSRLWCLGRVVRVVEAEDGAVRLCVAFEQIEPDDRDVIMAHCLAEQRKQLRMKVTMTQA